MREGGGEGGGPTAGPALSGCSLRAPHACVQSPRGQPTCRTRPVSQAIGAVNGRLTTASRGRAGASSSAAGISTPSVRSPRGGGAHLLDLRHHRFVFAQRVHDILERRGPVCDGRGVDGRRGRGCGRKGRIGRVLRGVVDVWEARVGRAGVRRLLGGGLGEDAEDAGDVGVHGGECWAESGVGRGRMCGGHGGLHHCPAARPAARPPRNKYTRSPEISPPPSPSCNRLLRRSSYLQFLEPLFPPIRPRLPGHANPPSPHLTATPTTTLLLLRRRPPSPFPLPPPPPTPHNAAAPLRRRRHPLHRHRPARLHSNPASPRRRPRNAPAARRPPPRRREPSQTRTGLDLRPGRRPRPNLGRPGAQGRRNRTDRRHRCVDPIQSNPIQFN